MEVQETYKTLEVKELKNNHNRLILQSELLLFKMDYTLVMWLIIMPMVLIKDINIKILTSSLHQQRIMVKDIKKFNLLTFQVYLRIS